MLVSSSQVGGYFLSDHSTRYIFLPFTILDFNKELALYHFELSNVLASFMMLALRFLFSIGRGFEAERGVGISIVDSLREEFAGSLIKNLSVSTTLSLMILLPFVTNDGVVV